MGLLQMLTAQLITPANFLITLTSQTLVLTPNRRLATRLRQSLLDKLTIGQTLLAPEILAYQDWLAQTQQQLYLHSKLKTQLLDTTAMDWLFTQTSPSDLTLLASPEQLAKTAKQAWQLAHEGCLPWQQLKQHTHPDYQWFARWAERLKAELDARQCTDIYDFTHQHSSLIATTAAQTYHAITWYGFMDFSVQQQRLQGAIEELGCRQLAYIAAHPQANQQQPHHVQAMDPQHELQSMLAHAKIAQEQGLMHIACVVPDLASCRAQIVTEVWRCFEPETPWPSYRKDAPVNISGGYYLSELAPVQTAIALIGLWQKTLPYTTLAHLLLSPYWGKQVISADLADVERLWRENVASHLPLANWLQLLPDDHPGAIWIQQQWQPIVNQARQLPKAAYPSQWVKLFKQQLLDLHWPGAKSLDSWHYQVADALMQQLEQLARYDTLMGSLDLNTMLQQWQHHLNQQLFQAQTQGQAIEVLGTLEATGLTWDSLWVCQLQADTFPQSAKPNPLLPLAWQRAANLPHSDAKREFTYAQTLLQTWQHQAAQLTLSYSLKIQGLPTEGSMLLDPWPVTHSKPPSSPLITQEAIQLEPIRESTIPRLEGTLKGGSYHLQYFLDCPFKAFGYYRLGIDVLAQKATGLDAMQRGQAIHRSLQLIWRQLHCHETLMAQDATSLDALIQQAINEALHPWQHQLSAVLWEQQVAWLKQVLHAWLEIEKNRVPFHIHSLEQTHTLTLGKLTLKLRSDRIDKYADGTLLVIDYKTGTTHISESFKTPLSAPQMPLYLLAIAAKDAGFAYVTLKPGKVGWEGASDTIPETELKTFTWLSTKINHETRSYTTQLSAWQTELDALATACADNQASIAPRTPDACRYCDLSSLCRLDERIQ